jgi:hypothetical protein
MVVVGAELQTDDLINDLTFGSQHQHGCLDTTTAKVLADIENRWCRAT